MVETSITTGSEPLTGHDLTSADGASGEGLVGRAIPALVDDEPQDFDAFTVTAAGRVPAPNPVFADVTHTAAGPALDVRRGANGVARTVGHPVEQIGYVAPIDATRRDVPDVPPGTIIADRYRIGEQLGVGGGGIVHAALDLDDETIVAIKLLHPRRLADRRAQLRFRREFRAVARLDHPHCLRVFEEGRAGPYLFMVMEFMPGGDLGRLSGAPAGVLLPLFVKLAGALDYVHGRRIVHRDLKPSNVMLTAGGRPEPKLADFGIAAMESEQNPTVTGAAGAQGTIDYMSPEQVRGEPVDPRSDLYAFGCMIFRLCSGRAPFLGSAYSRLVARLVQPAPDLTTVADVPPELARITARLLERDVALRYQSALDLAHDLAELTMRTTGPETIGPIVAATGASFLFEPGLVGREALVERIVEGMGPTSTARLIALVAPAGTGKTRLTEGIRRRMVDHRVVAVRIEADGGVPFAPIPDLEAAFGAWLPERAPTLDVESQRPVAEPWAASLRDRSKRLADAMIEAMAARPTVIFLDDLHLAGDGAAELLVALLVQLNRAGSDAPPMVATLRPIGEALLDRMAAGGASIERVPVTPLDARDGIELVARMLGLSVGEMPDGLAPFIRRTSGGNPLLARSDVQMLVDAGALVRVRGGWTFDPPGRGTDFMPTELLQGRLDALSPATLRVLMDATVAGERFDTALLCAAFRRGEDEVVDAIDEALRSRIVRADEAGEALDAYAFTHARLHEVLYKRLSDQSRRDGHGRIAAHLAKRPETPSAVMAQHLGRSDERAAACDAMIAAAEDALRVYDFAATEGFLLGALERLDALDPDRREATRAHCEELLADTLVALGRGPQAVDLLQALTRRSGQSALDRARRIRKLGTARLRTHDTAGGVEALEHALAVLGTRRPRTRFGVFVHIAREAAGALMRRLLRRVARFDAIKHEQAVCHRELGFMYRWIDAERSVIHLVATLRLAELTGDAEMTVDAYALGAVASAFLGLPGATVWFERNARSLAITHRDLIGEARVEVLSGAIDTMVHDDDAAAQAHFRRALAVTEQVGDRFLTDFVLTSKGWCDVLLGRFDDADRAFVEAHATAGDLGGGWMQADANAGRMMLGIARGRFDEARRLAEGLARPELSVQMPALGALGTEGLGGLAIQEGRYREAVRYYEQAQRTYAEHHLDRNWGFLISLQHMEALLCLVDTEGPEAVPDLIAQLKRLARLANRRMGRLKVYAGCVECCAGVIAARQGRTERARKLFARAMSRRRQPQESYMDTWLIVRTAFEELHMGTPKASVASRLDALDALYVKLGTPGMRPWLARMRAHYDV